MFKSIKKRSATSRILEEKLFKQVLKEISNGQRRDGLWAKAIANSNGREEKTKSLYIKYRVQSLKDEHEILNKERGNNKSSTKEKSVNINTKDIFDSKKEECNQKGSTIWVHLLVWSITGLIIFEVISQ